MAGSIQLTEPRDEPLALSEVKDYLRIDDQVDDNLVRGLIIAARTWCEEYTGRALITRDVQMFLDGISEADIPLFEGTRTGPYLTHYKNFIELDVSPVQSVTVVNTFDDADNEGVWDASNYFLDRIRDVARLVLRDGGTFPTDLRRSNGIAVTYKAGYGDFPTDVPEAIRVALLQFITHLYEHRGDDEGQALNPPAMIKTLLQPYRILRYGVSPFGVRYAAGIR
jgi:hypothetical protein